MTNQDHSNLRSKAFKQLQPFSLKAPNATSVQISGDFTQWLENPVDLKKNEHGVWTGSFLLDLGIHYYRFIVDGVATLDPRTIPIPSPEDGSLISGIHVLEAHGCSSTCCSQRALSERKCSKEGH
jgi:1,4-alpha-glucan branching enzyme